MAKILWFLLAVLQDGPEGAEQKARDRAIEMRAECATALESVEGVATVGVGGSGRDYRLLIAVRDAATQRHVRDLIGGDAYGGVRIVWSVSEPPRQTTPLAEPSGDRLQPRQPEPVPDRLNPWNASVTDCDIIREYLRMKPVTHPAGNGKSWTPCQVLRRTTIGPGGGHFFTYTSHRPDCPVRLGRVGEPPWADNYLSWVFRQGMTPAAGTNYTLPGNGWTWAAQAAVDMASRLPNIREGAQAGSTWVPGYGWVYSTPPLYPPPGYWYPYWRHYYAWPIPWHRHWFIFRFRPCR